MNTLSQRSLKTISAVLVSLATAAAFAKLPPISDEAKSKAAGKETKPAVATLACADPGAYTYVPAEAPKMQEAAGAHSPPATAISPPSGQLPAAAVPAAKKS